MPAPALLPLLLTLVLLARGCAAQCPVGCSACSSAANCTACTGGFQLQGTSCVAVPTSSDCGRFISSCISCRFLAVKGTVSKAVCSQCAIGYVARASGRACFCAPGFYTPDSTDVSGQVGFSCIPCGEGYWCPGARTTALSSHARNPCGRFTNTSGNQYATSPYACKVYPGYGYGPSGTSALCQQGFYNPGDNNRRCTPCQGGLTTTSNGSADPQDCAAPAGFYYLKSKAVACARGTFKSAVANEDCQRCPAGVTTANGTVGAKSAADCNTLLPGYAIDAAVLGVTDAVECPPNSYGASERAIGRGSTVGCTPCGDGLVTLPNVTASLSPDACLAAPGYGWESSATNPAGAATACVPGTYNPGYNRKPCSPCGGGSITTDGPGATGEDSCLTPAGHGNARDPNTGLLNGFACPLNTYGRPNSTYGLFSLPCTKCLDNTHTNQDACTSEAQCLAEPGYGWDDGSVNICDYGLYNPGDNKSPCVACAYGMNTSATDGAAEGILGATDASFCREDLGYTMGASRAVEGCNRGSYKDTIGSGPCTPCPGATWTTKTQAAIALSDCDVCLDGFGAFSASGPSCTVCASGTWSKGFRTGGPACIACRQAAGFTGKMVSRQGATDPTECYSEFPSDAADSGNTLAWDLIPMEASSLTLLAGATSMAACQAACAGNSACQYLAFYAQGGPDSGADLCYLRLGAAPVSRLDTAAVGGSWDAPTGVSLVLFEIDAARYVIYPKQGGEMVGVTLASGIPTLKAALDRCAVSAACIGLTNEPATKWRLFGGERREGATGKYRVVGEAIDSWRPLPSA